MPEREGNAPAFANGVLALPSIYRSANFSIKRSIFCASPGSRNACRNLRSASMNGISRTSIMSTNACIVAMFAASLETRAPSTGQQRRIKEERWRTYPSPRYSPTTALLRPSVASKNAAMSVGSLLGMNPCWTRKSIPRFALTLKRRMPSASVVFFCFMLSKRLGSSDISGVPTRVWSTEPDASRSLDALALAFPSVVSSSGTGPGPSAAPLAGSPGLMPHATSERRTATTVSRLCRRSAGSDCPSAAVSGRCTAPSADVVSDGARFASRCAADFGGGEVGGAADADACDAGPLAEPSFVIMFIRLCAARRVRGAEGMEKKGFGVLFEDVVGRGRVAVIVDVEIDERLRVLTDTRDHGDHDGLLLERCGLELKDGDEDLVE
jgi:hypothetical protein